MMVGRLKGHKNYTCKWCGKSYAQEWAYSKHMRMKHPNKTT